MFDILIYPILTIIFLFFLGYGTTMFFLPNKLREFSLWLSPWLAIVFLIILLTIFSLLGLSINQSSPIIIVLLTILNIFALFKYKHFHQFNLRNSIIIGLFIGTSLLLSLYPLLRHVKFLTAITMGNNDIVIYAQVSDYLIDHSIFDFLFKNSNLLKAENFGIGSLLYGGFRWSSPLLASFFMNIFQLAGYKFIYIFQTVLFSLAIPLYYVLFRTIYKRFSYGLVLVLGIFAFNSNLLYMLYHNFFGQVLFYGLSPLFLIFIYTYLPDSNILSRGINRFDIIIGLIISSLFFAYHEVTILVVTPLSFILFFNFLSKKNILSLWSKLLKILLITVITSSVSIVNAINIDFLQASNIDAPIGWALFRQKVSFANPFEMMGFYSIHYFNPLPTIIAIITSLFVIVLIFYGLYKSKFKHISFSFVFIYLLFFSWALIHNNFFAYNRVVTYTLPLFIILFAIGLVELFKKKKKTLIFLIVFLLFLELFFAIKLTKRFINEKLIVDKSLISLQDIKNVDIGLEPLYTEQAITGSIVYWKQIWTDYFLYPKATYSQNKTPKNVILDNSLILLSKTNYLGDPLKLVLNETIWQNEYYKIAKICNSNNCLLYKNKDFSKVDIGSNDYEDSLFLSGWGSRESNARWAVEKEATLRLITLNDTNVLKFEAYSLGEPEIVSIYINGTYVGTKNIKVDWNTYNLVLPYILIPGVNNVVLKFSHVFRPIDLGLNQDTRNLSVNFRKIALE